VGNLPPATGAGKVLAGLRGGKVATSLQSEDAASGAGKAAVKLYSTRLT
jgi:hypothetical protein